MYGLYLRRNTFFLLFFYFIQMLNIFFFHIKHGILQINMSTYSVATHKTQDNVIPCIIFLVLFFSALADTINFVSRKSIDAEFWVLVGVVAGIIFFIFSITALSLYLEFIWNRYLKKKSGRAKS